MKQIVTQKIELNNDELFILYKAKEILNRIAEELQEVSRYMVDDQILPEEINEAIKAAFYLEDVKIFSVFNILSDEQRKEIIK